MHAFFALLRKDLRLFLSDRRAVLLSLVAPIAIAAFFGSLFGGQDGPGISATLAVTDADQSAVSVALVQALTREASLTVKTMSADEATQALVSGKVHGWLGLPAGFGANTPKAMMGLAARPTVTLTLDPAQQKLRPLLEGLLAQSAMQAISAQLPGGASGQGFKLPFDVQSAAGPSRSDPGAGYNGYAHSFAGMGAQFILLFGVDVGIALLTLRGQGLWQRLRAAPIGRATLLGSRLASCALIAWAIFSVVMAVGVLAFGVPVRGSLPGLVLIMGAFGLFTAAFGLLVAAIGRTPEAARGLAILVTLLLVMLGGAWVPSFIFPPWLQAVSAWTPTHWVVSGMDAMTWRGQPFSAALAPIGVLLAFAAGLGGLALARFDWGD